MKLRRRHFLSVAAAGLYGLRESVHAQNVVEGSQAGGVGTPRPLPKGIVDDLVRRRWQCAASPAWDRAADEWRSGHPWRPFHHCLGISGQERYFDHAEELFFALSLTRPAKAESAEAVRAALAAMLERQPSFAAEGLPAAGGKAREPYTVPAELLLAVKRPARDLFGVYALWLFAERHQWPVADGRGEAALWDRLRPSLEERTRSIMAAMQPLSVEAKGKEGIAVRELNGNIAGLLGFIRLCPDSTLAADAKRRLHACLEQRVAFEAANPRVWTPSDLSTKSLHTVMLPRWHRLVPELGEVLAEYTGGMAAERVRKVRESMPLWWMARGDRLSGGENYTSPLHVSRALFSAAALIERLPAAALTVWRDVPWCRADLAWIERAAWCGGVTSDK